MIVICWQNEDYLGNFNNIHMPQMEEFFIYGDPAYPLRIQLQAPFRGPGLNAQQVDFNKSMIRVRVSVEWVFGDIINYFKFMDFRKNLKVSLSAVGKMYMVCACLQNCRTCLYGNQVSSFFLIVNLQILIHI